jgi:exodeoxyribonuclease VII small subunit
VADPSFEEALENLEKIVEKLEAGNLSLEETLKSFEEGIRLSRLCEKKLKQAQKKVSILVRGEEGELKEVPFTEPVERDKTEKERPDTESLFNE